MIKASLNPIMISLGSQKMGILYTVDAKTLPITYLMGLSLI
jgi:hypothetical protein